MADTMSKEMKESVKKEIVLRPPILALLLRSKENNVSEISDINVQNLQKYCNIMSEIPKNDV